MTTITVGDPTYRKLARFYSSLLYLRDKRGLSDYETRALVRVSALMSAAEMAYSPSYVRVTWDEAEAMLANAGG